MIAALGILVGAGLLVQALRLFTRVVGDLPPGATRARWQVLRGLVGLLIVAYLLHAFLVAQHGTDLDGLLLAIAFFVGASFVVIVAGLSHQTIQDLRRMTALEVESVTDQLTGMYNRRYLDRRCREEVERARRYHLPLSALLVDIDHFKRINDAHGHQVGDAVLVAMADLFRETIRQIDVPIRYGGEEFLILLPNTPGQAAAGVAERLRRTVETFAFPPSPRAPDAPMRCTVSVGVATLGDATVDAEGLIGAADAGLYEAKQTGRNRVVSRC